MSHRPRRTGLLVSVTVCFSIALATAVTRAQDRGKYSGLILDAAGDGIARAKIEFRVDDRVVIAYSDATGRFEINGGSFAPASGPMTLAVSAPGFETQRLSLSPAASAAPIEVRLRPSPIIERIQVIAGLPQETSEGPVRSLLRRDAIENSGA